MDNNTKAHRIAHIISTKLNNASLDDNYITEMLLDDCAQCIQLVIAGGIQLSDILAISKEFGDDNPNIWPESENEIRIVFCNDKHEELYTDSPQIELTMNID